MAERRQAEEALRLSELQLRQVLAVTGAGLWPWQIASGRPRHNPRCCELLGTGDAHTAHAMAEFVQRIHAQDRAAVMARTQACPMGAVPHFSAHRMVRAAGSTIGVDDRGDV